MSTAPHPVQSTATPADPAAQLTADAAPVEGGAAPAAPKKEKKEKKGKKGDLVAGMAALELDPKPQYIDSRIEMFDRLKKEYDEKVASEFEIPLSSPLLACENGADTG
jgi:threonyl-tRNA synthetase